MTAKSPPRLAPNLIRNTQYSGTISTLLYNWPIFAGLLIFGVAGLLSGSLLSGLGSWLLLLAGAGSLSMALNILVAAFIAYDYGRRREYDRLADLGHLPQANVVIDITAGKLRGTRGLLSRYGAGHYMVLDIYDPKKMADNALRRARSMDPPLETDRRIYKREADLAALPIPPNWADVVYCSFSLHEIQGADDRQQVFNQIARILKPRGRLLLAEHGRDWLNFLAFGPGFLSFLAPATWERHMTQAGLEIKRHERWRGLTHLWVAERKPR